MQVLHTQAGMCLESGPLRQKIDNFFPDFMTSPHVFKHNKWVCKSPDLPSPATEKRSQFWKVPVWRDMATMLHVKWGGEFWCCACLRDHWPWLML